MPMPLISIYGISNLDLTVDDLHANYSANVYETERQVLNMNTLTLKTALKLIAVQ